MGHDGQRRGGDDGAAQAGVSASLVAVTKAGCDRDKAERGAGLMEQELENELVTASCSSKEMRLGVSALVRREEELVGLPVLVDAVARSLARRRRRRGSTSRWRGWNDEVALGQPLREQSKGVVRPRSWLAVEAAVARSRG